MKTFTRRYIFSPVFILLSLFYTNSICLFSNEKDELVIPASVVMDKNNIRSWVWDNGVFNKGIGISSGFEWPKNTGKTAVYSAGFNVAAYINNQIRIAAAFYYDGEYSPGYCINGNFYTDNRFKLYKVSSGDNYISNPDWANWGYMVQYGAPYVDVNNSGFYEPPIDIPGVKGAAQTVFLCMTDADISAHRHTFPFYGSTLPLGAEVHLTAWVYDTPGLTDVQFFKWVVINKNTSTWDSVLCSIIAETDLGYAEDDAIGCDTNKNLGYCYNLDNDDDILQTSSAYGPNPPAFGVRLLNCSSSGSKLTSFSYFVPCACDVTCERYPTTPIHSYNFMNGIKKDGTPWVIPGTIPPKTTKFVFSGNIELTGGWKYSDGKIDNCGGSLTGNIIPAFTPYDPRFIMTSKPVGGKMNPGDTFIVQMVQMMARGTNNLNSVKVLSELSNDIYQFCQNGFVIGIQPLSTEIPAGFHLYQNYPNPFNPVTKISFDLPVSGNVTVKIFNSIGEEIETVLHEKLNAGMYSVDWNAASYPSGVYFYQIISGNYSETKKMVLIK